MDGYPWYRCGYLPTKTPKSTQSDVMNELEKLLNTKNDFKSSMKNFLLSDRWIKFCTDFGNTCQMFTCFKKFAKAEKCDTSLMVIFLQTCGYDLATWSIHEGTMTALGLTLRHAHNSKFDLWKKWALDRNILLAYHPVTECMFYGRWNHVDFLLNYGYNIEYSHFWYDTFVEDVLQKLAISSEERTYLKDVKFNPLRKRGFLICMAIRAYIYEFNFPYTYGGCDAALRSIWNRLPDAYLTKDEFLSILDPFPAKLDRLAAMYDRYISAACDGDYSLAKQPRTLAHYCRCRVRQILCNNFSLPGGVHGLQIPATLKNYLLHK